MNIFKSFSRKTLAITLTLFLLFCSVSTYSWYYNFTKEAEATAKENIGVLISTLNSTFESNLREIDYTTALISNKVRTSQNKSLIQYLTLDNTQTTEMVTALQEAQNYLLSRCNFKAYLNGLAVYGLDGRTCTYGVTTPYREVYVKDWFQQIKDGEYSVLYLAPHSYTETEHAPLSGRVFSIVRPVMNNGEIIGIIKADIKVSLLDTIFDIQQLSGYMLYIVESDSGELIYAPEDFSTVDVAALYKQMPPNQRGSMTMEIAGNDYLVVFSASEVTPWTLIGIVEQDHVIAGFVKVRNEMLVITLVCIILFVVFMGIIVRFITRDLRTLTSAVSSINDENISIAVNIHSHDEVGTLYQQICAMLNRIRNLVSDIRKTEREKREAEIKMLSLQINPHFLYNTLHTIKVLSMMQGTENITTVTDALSNILHLNLDTRKFISMPEEADYLRDYLSIQEFRYVGKFTFNISLEEEAKRCMIPKLLLQPIVENALQHGISVCQTVKSVQVNAFAEDGVLHIIIKNSGKEFDPNLLDDEGRYCGQGSKHIGLQNIFKRLKLLFGDKGDLRIYSESNLFTSVEVTLPAITVGEVENYDTSYGSR